MQTGNIINARVGSVGGWWTRIRKISVIISLGSDRASASLHNFVERCIPMHTRIRSLRDGWGKAKK